MGDRCRGRNAAYTSSGQQEPGRERGRESSRSRQVPDPQPVAFTTQRRGPGQPSLQRVPSSSQQRQAPPVEPREPSMPRWMTEPSYPGARPATVERAAPSPAMAAARAAAGARVSSSSTQQTPGGYVQRAQSVTRRPMSSAECERPSSRQTYQAPPPPVTRRAETPAPAPTARAQSRGPAQPGPAAPAPLRARSTSRAPATASSPTLPWGLPPSLAHKYPGLAPAPTVAQGRTSGYHEAGAPPTSYRAPSRDHWSGGGPSSYRQPPAAPTPTPVAPAPFRRQPSRGRAETSSYRQPAVPAPAPRPVAPAPFRPQPSQPLRRSNESQNLRSDYRDGSREAPLDRSNSFRENRGSRRDRDVSAGPYTRQPDTRQAYPQREYDQYRQPSAGPSSHQPEVRQAYPDRGREGYRKASAGASSSYPDRGRSDHRQASAGPSTRQPATRPSSRRPESRPASPARESGEGEGFLKTILKEMGKALHAEAKLEANRLAAQGKKEAREWGQKQLHKGVGKVMDWATTRR